VLLLGLAYKADTGDAREAPGTVIAERLSALGAEVRVADPHLAHDAHGPFTLVDLTAEELESADGVVLVTDHTAFDYELVTAHASYVLDTRGRLEGPNVERL
jgi:UDP-N-acetyl-D-glucosamine dehydrogenase